MKVIAWPKEEGADARELEISSLEALWHLVRGRTSTPDDRYIHELSANLDSLDDAYLVLAWVEVEPSGVGS
jgi:hypothetical protein